MCEDGWLFIFFIFLVRCLYFLRIFCLRGVSFGGDRRLLLEDVDCFMLISVDLVFIDN